MKIWADDKRPPPDDSWTWWKECEPVLAVIRGEVEIDVEVLSLDNDFGFGKMSGIEMLASLYLDADKGRDLKIPPDVRFHSQSAYGREIAERAWADLMERIG